MPEKRGAAPVLNCRLLKPLRAAVNAERVPVADEQAVIAELHNILRFSAAKQLVISHNGENGNVGIFFFYKINLSYQFT